MFPVPTELLLIGCSIESIWTPKIQINYIDTKNQLADMLNKGNLHVINGIICFVCSTLASHFSPIDNFEGMSKRTPEDAGEESHSKVETYDEFGPAVQRKDS